MSDQITPNNNKENNSANPKNGTIVEQARTLPDESGNFIAYSKDALAKFKKIDYKNSLNGHWDM